MNISIEKLYLYHGVSDIDPSTDNTGGRSILSQIIHMFFIQGLKDAMKKIN